MKNQTVMGMILWIFAFFIAVALSIYLMGVANVLVLGLGTLISLPLWAWAVYLSAKTDRQFTFRRTGEIKFSKDGEVIDTVIAHVPGFFYDKENDLMVEEKGSANGQGDETDSKFSRLVKKLASVFVKDAKKDKSGLVLVSLLYPYRRLHSWKFTWTKFASKTHSEAGRDRVFDDYLIEERTEDAIKSLYFQYIYPIVVREIDLKGKIQIKILLQVTLRVRKPLHIIGFYKGNFLSAVISEIKGIVDNGVGHTKDIDEWYAEDRESVIDKLLHPYKNKLLQVLGGDLEIVDASYVSFDFDGPNAEINRKAASQKELNRLEGDGTIEKATKEAEAEKKRAEQEITRAQGAARAAEHEATAITSIAAAKAADVRMALEQAAKHPQGVEFLLARERTAATAAFRGSTLIMDGSRGGVMVSAGESKPTQGEPKKDKKGEKEVSS
ncbi:MAG: hypothetical protein Q8L64_05510 [bacterium]|nr:hypothetical protein [bacterium]